MGNGGPCHIKVSNVFIRICGLLNIPQSYGSVTLGDEVRVEAESYTLVLSLNNVEVNFDESSNTVSIKCTVHPQRVVIVGDHRMINELYRLMKSKLEEIGIKALKKEDRRILGAEEKQSALLT